ncbi:hypothetical protein GH714_030427 [Hevea brasiliensis]|uniref:Reverse transcriptase/retrotransposon-derived protein RNase H-like domain-containing protein n=1 Tax=Hevea brasiliensis TaxID=3981 RepID=A0A6A6NKG1_HEVBR|nr:hypothetical protein GH714_030427 [Hevea brasiliensis]
MVISLQLFVVPTEPFTVKVANGAPLQCQWRFEHVHVLLQGIPFFLTLYSLPLVGIDLLLGVQWLEQLGTVVCNWKKMTMEFQWNDQMQKLQGTDVQPIQSASVKAFSKELRQGNSMFAICLQTEAKLPQNGKGHFGWNDEAKTAFEVLNQAMTTTPTLAMPNFNEPFIIESNASGDGIGVVLTQHGKPIAFMSRSLGLSKRSWSTYAREMLTIVQAVQIWRPYLMGRKFFIQTDQHSLKYFLEQRIVTPEQQKWVSKLLGYDYEIIYKPGNENLAADTLSRMVGSPHLDAIVVSQAQIWDEIKEVAINHLYMQKIGKLATEKLGVPYTWQNGLVCYKNRVVVPPNFHIIKLLLREFHDSQIGGHSGVL